PVAARGLPEHASAADRQERPRDDALARDRLALEVVPAEGAGAILGRAGHNARKNPWVVRRARRYGGRTWVLVRAAALRHPIPSRIISLRRDPLAPAPRYPGRFSRSHSNR